MAFCVPSGCYSTLGVHIKLHNTHQQYTCSRSDSTLCTVDRTLVVILACPTVVQAPPHHRTSDETASNQRANYMDALAQCQRANLRKEQTLHTKSKSQVYAWKHAEVRCECPAAASPGITDRMTILYFQTDPGMTRDGPPRADTDLTFLRRC